MLRTPNYRHGQDVPTRRRKPNNRARRLHRITVMECLEERMLLASILDISTSGSPPGALTFNGAAGATNDLTVMTQGPSGNYIFTDPGDTITLGSGAISDGWNNVDPNSVEGPDSSVGSITISFNTTDTTATDIANIQSIDASTLILNGNGAATTVNVGVAGSVQGITQLLDVEPTGLYNLNLDDSADATARSVTIMNEGLTGLAPGGIDYSGFGIPPGDTLTIDGGTGGNSFTVDDTGNSDYTTGFAGTYTINTGTGNNSVDVEALPDANALDVNGQGASDDVTVSNGGTVSSIQGPVTVTGVGTSTALTVDDSGDQASTTATLTASSLTGISPDPIDYSNLSALTIDGAAYGNTFTVQGTGAPTTLNSGAGQDVVGVTGVNQALTIDGEGVSPAGADDTVYVTEGPSIAGAIDIVGSTGDVDLTVDDSAGITGVSANLAVGALTGFSGQPIQFQSGALAGIAIDGGAGDDTLTVDFTSGDPIPAALGLLFDGGSGTNTLALTGGSFSDDSYDASGTAAGSILLDGAFVGFSSVQAIQDDVTATTYQFTAPFQANGITIQNDSIPPSTSAIEVTSGDMPAHFAQASVANKTNVTISAAGSGTSSPQTINLDTPSSAPGLNGLTVDTGSADDTITVTATPPNVATSINTGGGDDLVSVTATGLGAGGTDSFDGVDGAGTMDVDAGGNAVSVASMSVSVAGYPTIGVCQFALVDVTDAADQPLDPSPTTISATAGVPLSSTVVGRFTDTDTAGQAGDFSATINWGDGPGSSIGTITQPGGPGTPFVVSGTHTYSFGGTIPLTVTVQDHGSTSSQYFGTTLYEVSDNGGASTTIASTADVTGPPMVTWSPLPVTATEGLPFTAPVASFAVADSQLGAFSASPTIDWGDGSSPTPGVIEAGPDGTYLVEGTHEYELATKPGAPYVVTVTFDVCVHDVI